MSTFSGNGYLMSVMRRGSAPAVPVSRNGAALRPALSPEAPHPADELRSIESESIELVRDLTSSRQNLTETTQAPVGNQAPDRFPESHQASLEIAGSRDSKQISESLADRNYLSPPDVEVVPPPTPSGPALETRLRTMPPKMDAALPSSPEAQPREPEETAITTPTLKQMPAIVELKLPRDFFVRRTLTMSEPQFARRLDYETEKAKIANFVQPKPRSGQTVSRVETSVSPDRSDLNDLGRISLPTVVSEKQSVSAAFVPATQPASRQQQIQAAPIVVNTSSAEEKFASRNTKLDPTSAEVSDVIVPVRRHDHLAVSSSKPAVAAPTPPNPQPRLRINQLDIQIINQTPAQQPGPPNPPSDSRLLERRYLHRSSLGL
jgi:hypothetical protein